VPTPVQVTVPTPVQVPYPVERVVDVPIPAPYDRVVERRVDVPYDVPVPYVDTVQVPVEVVRTVEVPYPVEQIVEKIVERIVHRPYHVPREEHFVSQVNTGTKHDHSVVRAQVLPTQVNYVNGPAVGPAPGFQVSPGGYGAYPVAHQGYPTVVPAPVAYPNAAYGYPTRRF